MGKIVKGLQGKKTYISAAALALVAILGWWFGALSQANALALLCLAGASAGLGAKSERYAQATLAALSNVRDAQAQHKPLDIKALAAEIIQNVTTVSQEQCKHDLSKWIGNGQLKCLECGAVFTPTDEQLKKWQPAAPTSIAGEVAK
jgi:hypothetical protein